MMSNGNEERLRAFRDNAPPSRPDRVPRSRQFQPKLLMSTPTATLDYLPAAIDKEVYLKAYANGLEARRGLREYFRFYNDRRPHQALGYRTPAEVFYGEPVEEEEDLKERRCSNQPVLVSCGGVQESHLIVA